ncbi:MAG TPA: hypothetical protein PKY05_00290 [Fibrobacteria bacterium]|nr:hypothetical protein [Fibrobacteria bacterium]
MGGKIQLTGRQAVLLYDFLGTKTKISASDKMRLGRLRRRLHRMLETNDEGIHEALNPTMRTAIYTPADLQHGIPREMVGKPVLKPDGKPLELYDYATADMSRALGEIVYDSDEAGTLFRFCRARIEDADSSGAIAEHVLRVASWFPGVVDAIEKSLVESYKEDPFQYVAPPSDGAM